MMLCPVIAYNIIKIDNIKRFIAIISSAMRGWASASGLRDC
jgi:hypothetical protein